MDTCRVDMGRASLTSKDFPGGPAGRAGALDRPMGASGRFSTSRSATRSARSAWRTWRSSRRSICRRSGRRSKGMSCSRTARTCRGTRRSRQAQDGRSGDPRADLRAREWERRCPRARARRARRSPTVCRTKPSAGRSRCALDGGELEVEVGEELQVNLTGWARPVFAGTLSEEFVKELHETE